MVYTTVDERPHYSSSVSSDSSASSTDKNDGGNNPMKVARERGLYDPRFERDACGVGFVVNIDGKSSHKVSSLLANGF
jgi:hypothetical protein